MNLTTELNAVNTTEQVCKFLQISRGLLYEEMKEGRITAFKAGRSYRFTKKAVEAYIERMTVIPTEIGTEGETDADEKKTAP